MLGPIGLIVIAISFLLLLNGLIGIEEPDQIGLSALLGITLLLTIFFIALQCIRHCKHSKHDHQLSEFEETEVILLINEEAAVGEAPPATRSLRHTISH